MQYVVHMYTGGRDSRVVLYADSIGQFISHTSSGRSCLGNDDVCTGYIGIQSVAVVGKQAHKFGRRSCYVRFIRERDACRIRSCHGNVDRRRGVGGSEASAIAARYNTRTLRAAPVCTVCRDKRNTCRKRIGYRDAGCIGRGNIVRRRCTGVCVGTRIVADIQSIGKVLVCTRLCRSCFIYRHVGAAYQRIGMQISVTARRGVVSEILVAQ